MNSALLDRSGLTVPLRTDRVWLHRSHLKQHAMGPMCTQCGLSTVRSCPVVDTTRQLQCARGGQDGVRSGRAPSLQFRHSEVWTLSAGPAPCSSPGSQAQARGPSSAIGMPTPCWGLHTSYPGLRRPRACWETTQNHPILKQWNGCYQLLWPHDGQDPGVSQKLLVVKTGLLQGQTRRADEFQRPRAHSGSQQDRPVQHGVLGGGLHPPRRLRPVGEWGGSAPRPMGGWGGGSEQPTACTPCLYNSSPCPLSRQCPREGGGTGCVCGAQPPCVHG